MGQSERLDLLPLHVVLLAVRQRGAQSLSEHADHGRAVRHAGVVCRAGQVDGEAAGDEDGHEPPYPAHQYGGGTCRCVGALQALAGCGVRVCVPARLGGVGRQSGALIPSGLSDSAWESVSDVLGGVAGRWEKGEVRCGAASARLASLFSPFHRIRSTSAPKNTTILTIPLAVKNTEFSFERSPGFTLRCS